MRRSCIRRIDARPSVYALNDAHGAAAQLYTPSGLPYQHGRPVASACRNRQTGSALCRAKAAKRSASARAPDGAVGPRLVHIPPAPSGSQRSPAVGRSRRLQARSCGNRSRGGTLIRMRSRCCRRSARPAGGGAPTPPSSAGRHRTPRHTSPLVQCRGDCIERSSSTQRQSAPQERMGSPWSVRRLVIPDIRS
jgi:hypothetical protein